MNVSRLLGMVMMMVLLVGCVKKGSPTGSNPIVEDSPLHGVVVALSDFRSGLLLGVSMVGGATEAAVPIHSDAIVRVGNDGTRYVVNRLGRDNLQLVSKGGHPIKEITVGRGTNPQDVVVTSDAAYVSRFRSRSLVKVGLKDGKVLTEIDLGNYSDADGFPEMTWMYRQDNQLFVLLQRLDTQNGFMPTDKSQVAVVNLEGDRVSSVFDLARTNPVTAIKKAPDGKLYVGCAGLISTALDGGIVSLETKSQVVAEEEELKGDIIDFAWYGPEQMVVIVATPTTNLVPINPRTGKAGKPWIESEGFHLQQVLWDAERNQLLVSDRNPTKPGIRVLDGETGAEKAFIQMNELPPYFMELSP